MYIHIMCTILFGLYIYICVYIVYDIRADFNHIIIQTDPLLLQYDGDGIYTLPCGISNMHAGMLLCTISTRRPRPVINDRSYLPKSYLFIAHIHHDFRSYCGRVEKIKVRKKHTTRLCGINNARPMMWWVGGVGAATGQSF